MMKKEENTENITEALLWNLNWSEALLWCSWCGKWGKKLRDFLIKSNASGTLLGKTWVKII